MFSLRTPGPSFVLAAIAALAAACSFDPGVGATQPDANAPDSLGTPGCHSFSSQFDTCLLTPSDASLTLSGQHTHATTMGKLYNGTPPAAITRMQIAGKAGPLEVLIVDDFRMATNARLRATGTTPLAILAFGSIAIDAGATIDVSAGGAGARI